MISYGEVRLAERVIKQACQESKFCFKCPHKDNCKIGNKECSEFPGDWDIPTIPPDPTERPRIEWLRMLPDGEMAKAMDNMQNGDCSSCEYCLECSCDVDSPCNKGHMDWWHEVVSLEQFRKDVELND